MLFVLVASGTAILFRQGLVAPVFNPLPLIDLAQPRPWAVDWRLASIRNYPELCARTLKAPYIEAQPIPDNPIRATANAADISGFTLADGRSISIRTQWRGDTPEGRFLRAVHRAACPYFRVALSPDYNAAHHDHFHLDRGPLSRCK